MNWNSKSHPALVDAIVASFRGSSQEVRERLAGFHQRDWHRTAFWLDSSGLALYFLDRIRALRAGYRLPPGLLRSLESRHLANARRVEALNEQFVDLNHAFKGRSIRYANLKGFTLFPHSCADLTLRTQSDFDFLVNAQDLHVCRELLEQRGYQLRGTTARSLEFKTPVLGEIPRNAQYSASIARSVELHIALDGMRQTPQEMARDFRLDRLGSFERSGESFPALMPHDLFVGQALHVLGHLRNEHTRVSWLLEFRNHALTHAGDAQFWKDVREAASREPEARIGLGLSISLASELFGAFGDAELISWTVAALPASVREWASRYGRRAVLADAPGTKLYLLLEECLRETVSASHARERRQRLVPSRLPSRVLPLPRPCTVQQRLRSDWFQLRFLLYRARFHVLQGVRYAFERRRFRHAWTNAHKCASETAMTQSSTIKTFP